MLWGLLTSAEEAAAEENREAGEKEAELEKVSKKLDIVVKKILVNTRQFPIRGTTNPQGWSFGREIEYSSPPQNLIFAMFPRPIFPNLNFLPQTAK